MTATRTAKSVQRLIPFTRQPDGTFVHLPTRVTLRKDATVGWCVLAPSEFLAGELGMAGYGDARYPWSLAEARERGRDVVQRVVNDDEDTITEQDEEI